MSSVSKHINPNIRCNIRTIRIILGFTCREVSEDIGVSQQTLYRYEREPSTTPLYVAKRLAEYYGVSLDELDYT